jgi:ATP-binding cassette subfamily F protein 3
MPKSKDEVKKVRAEIIREKSRILKPLEEKMKIIETTISVKEKEFNSNTERLVIASVKGDIDFLSEGAKLDKILKSEIENLYTELAFSVDKLERETERFQKLLKKLD